MMQKGLEFVLLVPDFPFKYNENISKGLLEVVLVWFDKLNQPSDYKEEVTFIL